ncbi:MAG: FHA domain-containing protein [Nitrospira sp.]|nr:FHA domain-containing protein [Candidatus Manganitrophaceae bacterium]HIL35262.1 FHA domain-containing protein [Candidatus Manganitrophaceae bacterium]
MIKNLITHQKEQLSETQCSAEHIRAIIQEIKSKKELITAVLLREENEHALLLFILQDEPCFCYALKDNSFSPHSISEFLGEGTNLQGNLALYKVSPIFFKTLLVLAQKDPDVFAGSDLINIENLLKHLQTREQDAVLSLKKGVETSLFYFIKGNLSEGYFENKSGLGGETKLQDQLLVYTYSANEKPVTFNLYYDLELSSSKEIGDAFSKPEESPANPSRSHPLLILVEGEKQNEGNRPIEMILDKEVFTLGCDPENDWTVDSPASSRKHATIERCADGFYLEDQESRNGTFVNQNRIARHKLSHGDKIQIGLHYFVFSDNGNGESNVTYPVSLVPDNGDISASMEEDDDQVLSIDEEPLDNWGLEIISGKMTGTFYNLAGRRISLGRGNTDIQVKDPQVSRHHADIEWTTEGFVISDRKSANGVTINDHLVTTKQLLLEDVIKIGDTRLRVVCKE